MTVTMNSYGNPNSLQNMQLFELMKKEVQEVAIDLQDIISTTEKDMVSLDSHSATNEDFRNILKNIDKTHRFISSINSEVKSFVAETAKHRLNNKTNTPSLSQMVANLSKSYASEVLQLQLPPSKESTSKLNFIETEDQIEVAGFAIDTNDNDISSFDTSEFYNQNTTNTISKNDLSNKNVSHISKRSRSGFEEKYSIDKCRELPQGCIDFIVLISDMKSPDEFYIQLCKSDLEVLHSLIESLKLFYNRVLPPMRYQLDNLNNMNRKRIAMVDVKKYGAYYDDDAWIRVEVLDWRITEDTPLVTVFALDYGDTLESSLFNLRPLDQQFLNYARFAVKCHLSGIHPVSGYPDCRGWSSKAIETFQSLCNIGKHEINALCIKIVQSEMEKTDSVPVELFLNENSVNELLVQKGHARKAVSRTQRIVTQLSQTSLHEKEFTPVRESLASNNERKTETKKRNWNVFKLISKPFASPNEEINNAVCRRPEFSFAPKPSCKSLHPVKITNFVNQNRFFCQLADSEFEDSTQDFVQTLQKAATQLRKSHSFEMGEPVISVFSEDQLWYRGLVVELNKEERLAKVFFVDYGNEEEVSFDNIRKITQELLNRPIQAIECEIQNIVAKPGVNRDIVLNFMYAQAVDICYINVVGIKDSFYTPGNNFIIEVTLLNGEMIDVGLEAVQVGIAYTI